MKKKALSVSLCLALCGQLATGQEDLPQEQVKFFEEKIRPALSTYCYECHSEESGKTRGGLLVDTRTGLLQGGDSGPALVPGDLHDSLLWDAITWADRDYEMPPKKKMPDEVIADFERWITMGAPDPRIPEEVVVDSKIDIEEGRKHWAFQKPEKPEVPEVHDMAWSKGEIDEFVLAKLEQKGLKPVADARPETLLRRMSYDLVGLPPKPEEVREFVAAWKEDADRAIAAKVDELLARTQFGERWGRHWLDVARYAESTGKDVNFTYPYAWRYRDYVIDSFNADKPYDQFIQEQIAGDLLPAASDEAWQENLIATGFLAIGTKGLNEPNPRQFQADVIDEQIDAVSQAILGLTVSCARCHDHKTDPIPTSDYYALAGIFLSTDTLYGTAGGLQNRRPTDLILLPVADTEAGLNGISREEYERLVEQRRSLRERMVEIRREGPSGGNAQQQIIRTRALISGVEQRMKTYNPDGSAKVLAMGVQDKRNTTDARVLVRGEVEKPAQAVPRGFPQVLEFDGQPEINTGQSGRRELAEWITSKQNPLTARVMVNRVWQQIFGEGIVPSANNWGTTGQPPSHPELLDYLAVRFVENGWSVKSLIRDILTTRTYRLSSDFDSTCFNVDPDCKLRWRSQPRQLDAEALRDSMLVAAGALDYERPVGSEVTESLGGRAGRQFDGSTMGNSNYRSVYLPQIRDMLPESLALFDFPDSSAPSEKRPETNMPSQALYLMNSEFVEQQAEEMADRLLNRFPDRTQLVQAAFLLAYSRPASEEEIRGSKNYFRMFMEAAPADADGRDRAQRLAVESFCQALLASAEFRILD